MMSGPDAAPTPKQACSQFSIRGPWWVATYVFSAASIAPEPRPSTAPSASIASHEADEAYPSRAAAVSPQLTARTVPRLRRPSRCPLEKLDAT